MHVCVSSQMVSRVFRWVSRFCPAVPWLLVAWLCLTPLRASSDAEMSLVFLGPTDVESESECEFAHHESFWFAAKTTFVRTPLVTHLKTWSVRSAHKCHFGRGKDGKASRLGAIPWKEEVEE